MVQVGRRADDHADRATGMQNLAVLAEDFDQRHDLRAERVDQVRMVVDSIGHIQTVFCWQKIKARAKDAKSQSKKERSLGQTICQSKNALLDERCTEVDQ